MLDVVLSHHFKKDLKLAQKRGYDIALLMKWLNSFNVNLRFRKRTAIMHYAAIMSGFVSATSNPISCWSIE